MIVIGYHGKIISENMEKAALICELDRLSDPGSYGFSLQLEGRQVEGFVVRRDGEYFAYRNSCPHTGAPLEWLEHQFLDVEGALIQCSTHDARFLIDTGECVFGPCPGESLEALPIEVRDAKIYLLTEA